MLRTGRFKYCVYNSGTTRESLVDLQHDPGEMKNLASNPDFRDVLNNHRTHLQQWIVESNDADARSFSIMPD